MRDKDGEREKGKEEEGEGNQRTTAGDIGESPRREVHHNSNCLLECVKKTIGFYANLQHIRHIEDDKGPALVYSMGSPSR